MRRVLPVADHLGVALGDPRCGALEAAPLLRQAIAELPCGEAPDARLCQELGRRLARHTCLDRIRAIAGRPAIAEVRPVLFRPGSGISRTRVAVAYDDAFHCYFNDTLDLLELRGAETVDFSPLADAELPEDADIVYLGCGHPERFARELIQNQCMMLALRNHVCAGRRIYAEGGGLAYLCQQIITPEGHAQDMLGVLPAVARVNPSPVIPPEPVELVLSGENWLGPVGDRLRGYTNNGWLLEPWGALDVHANDNAGAPALVGRRRAIGSRVHFNFAVQPHAFDSFLKPHAECVDWGARG